MAQDSQNAINVKIYTPFKVYFDGQATSVSAVNKTGPFDILPHHKNFMTLLSPGVITVRLVKSPDFTLKISRGVMHVKANRTTVFLDV